MIELRARGPVYERLRSWSSRDLQSPLSDPIYGLLASGSGLPPSFRAVAQLAFAPLPEVWARPYRRLALSHPLEEERERRRETRVQGRQGRAPGWGAIISLFLLVVGLTAWRYGRMERFLPA